MLAEGDRPVYASGECEIDLARRELRILGSPVPIGGRAFEIIEALAQSVGELVTKDELMNRIWPGAIVMENTLQVHAAAVRKALGPYRGLLKTESRRGYRLLETLRTITAVVFRVVRILMHAAPIGVSCSSLRTSSRRWLPPCCSFWWR